MGNGATKMKDAVLVIEVIKEKRYLELCMLWSTKEIAINRWLSGRRSFLQIMSMMERAQENYRSDLIVSTKHLEEMMLVALVTKREESIALASVRGKMKGMSDYA